MNLMMGKRKGRNPRRKRTQFPPRTSAPFCQSVRWSLLRTCFWCGGAGDTPGLVKNNCSLCILYVLFSPKLVIKLFSKNQFTSWLPGPEKKYLVSSCYTWLSTACSSPHLRLDCSSAKGGKVIKPIRPVMCLKHALEVNNESLCILWVCI